MGSEVENAGMTPEQKAGIVAGAAFAAAGLAFSVIRRRSKKQTRAQATADRIAQNPTLKNLYAAARESLEDARGRVDPKTIEAAKKELAKQRESIPATWQSDFEPAARDLANRALQSAQRLRSEGSVLTRDLAKRWEKEYGPSARAVAGDAVQEADQIVASARKRATEFSDVARKEYIPKLVPIATSARDAVAERSQKVSKQLKDGKGPRAALSRDMKKPSLRREQPGVMKRAGQSAKSFTGQLFMIGFWGAALGAVVYFGLLDEERRQKVRAYLTDAYDQVTELIEDFQDEDVFGQGETTERF